VSTGTVIPARNVDPESYRIGGCAPRAALRPASRDELCEALRMAARDGLGVVPWGGGVALAGELAADRYDLAIDLRALDRIVEYEPEDLTLTAECGVTIATLRATLAERGQELPIEAPHAHRATLGGSLAANASGPRRYDFGAPRDRILGARWVLADGSLVRSGGKVVKNVAGYGIHRLLCGSRGGLAIIVEASLKLMPAPAARRALVYAMSLENTSDPSQWTPFSRLEPAVLTIAGREAAEALGLAHQGKPYTAVVGLEADAEWVERQAKSTMDVLGPPALELQGTDALDLWQRLADVEERAGARLTFTTAERSPARLRPWLEQPVGRTAVFHVLAGRIHLGPEGSEAPAMVKAMAESGFHLIDARALPSLEPALPAQVAVAALRSRIRDAFDPDRRLALGDRWVGPVS